MSDQPDLQPKRFTYGDYLTWPEEERWELIEGIPFNMTPAPSLDHQSVAGEIYRQAANFLLHHPCRVFIAPFDVRLAEGDEPDDQVPTVVQPDVSVVCDPAKLDRRGCRGAPDWIVEVLSPSTALKDQSEKLALYRRHGVREYWLLSAADRSLVVYTLSAPGAFGSPQHFPAAGLIPVTVVPGLSIDFDLVFREYPATEL